MLRSKGTCYFSWQEIWNIDLIFLHLPSSRYPEYIVRKTFCICCRMLMPDQINSDTVQWEGYRTHSPTPIWPRSVRDVHAHPTGCQYPACLWFLIVIVIFQSWNKGWLTLHSEVPLQKRVLGMSCDHSHPVSLPLAKLGVTVCLIRLLTEYYNP